MAPKNVSGRRGFQVSAFPLGRADAGQYPSRAVAKKPSATPARWLLLIHQIPPEPNYLRVKISRRLARIGAVQLKSTVYALPQSDTCHEDFLWLRRELIDSGGEASIFEASVIEGLSDGELKALFRAQRDPDYASIEQELDELAKRIGQRRPESTVRAQAEAELARIERRLQDIQRIDFFDAERGQRVKARVQSLHLRLAQAAPLSPADGIAVIDPRKYKQRTWVTRTGIKVDRIASAWLIRRFIDPHARFRFVEIAKYAPAAKDLRFDMANGEFTHVRDLCTFEVLCERFRLEDPALRAIAEIVHDLDVKDARYGRPDNEGVASMVQGIVASRARDGERLTAGSTLFDALYARFQA
jgi:hypothetical protein